MEKAKPFLIETINGPSVQMGEAEAKLQGRSLAVNVQLPFWQAMLKWSRPTVIMVDIGGHRSFVPIVDIGRLSVFAAAGAGAVAAFGIWSFRGLISREGGIFR